MASDLDPIIFGIVTAATVVGVYAIGHEIYRKVIAKGNQSNKGRK